MNFHSISGQTRKIMINGLDYAHTEKYDTYAYGCLFKIMIFQFYSYAATQLNSRSRSLLVTCLATGVRLGWEAMLLFSLSRSLVLAG